MPQQGSRPAGCGTRSPADDCAAGTGRRELTRHPDATRLIASRGTRGLVDGAVAVAIAAYGEHLGWSGRRIGVVVTGMLLGSAVLTLWVGVRGGAIRRRALLVAGAITMIVSGVVYASTTAFAVLLVVGVIGTMNPTGGDVSVFAPIEQSMLPRTAPDAERTALFARYVFAGGALGAVGALASGLPGWFAHRAGSDPGGALRWVFAAYALGGVAVLVIVRGLSPAAEPPPAERPTPLGPSRRIVGRLAVVFAIDSFAGGFVVQSLLALWLFRRFDLSVAQAGLLLFWTGVCSAFSVFASPRIAARVGLVRTMAYTHMPAQVLLIAAAFMPSLSLAVACLIGRSLLSAMDVPARSSYVMAVVSPSERAAAASVTQVPRSLASAIPPLFAGWLLDRTTFGWPLVIAGSLKLVYDVTLLTMFREVRPPEEQRAAHR